MSQMCNVSLQGWQVTSPSRGQAATLKGDYKRGSILTKHEHDGVNIVCVSPVIRTLAVLGSPSVSRQSYNAC